MKSKEQIQAKLKPILFSTSMVQSILTGNKSQTRRIIKPQPDSRGLRNGNGLLYEDWHGSIVKAKCQIGDILWVRETWSKTDGGKYIYRASNPQFNPIWKPSIFMFREAARIFLKVTNIRVERLQDISNKDAIAEGIDMNKSPCIEPMNAYASLWESINGKGSWSLNPFVWVIEFERTINKSKIVESIDIDQIKV